jgi:hypothetical protein
MTSQDTTIVVSVGKDVNGVPMDPTDWDGFKQDAEDVLRFNGSRILFVGEGTGVWDGKYETAFTIVAALDDDGTQRVLDIIGRYSVLAHQYGQEAIAVTFGATIMATATPDYETFLI